VNGYTGTLRGNWRAWDGGTWRGRSALPVGARHVELVGHLLAGAVEVVLVGDGVGVHARLEREGRGGRRQVSVAQCCVLLRCMSSSSCLSPLIPLARARAYPLCSLIPFSTRRLSRAVALYRSRTQLFSKRSHGPTLKARPGSLMALSPLKAPRCCSR